MQQQGKLRYPTVLESATEVRWINAQTPRSKSSLQILKYCLKLNKISIFSRFALHGFNFLRSLLSLCSTQATTWIILPESESSQWQNQHQKASKPIKIWASLEGHTSKTSRAITCGLGLLWNQTPRTKSSSDSSLQQYLQLVSDPKLPALTAQDQAQSSSFDVPQKASVSSLTGKEALVCFSINKIQDFEFGTVQLLTQNYTTIMQCLPEGVFTPPQETQCLGKTHMKRQISTNLFPCSSV